MLFKQNFSILSCFLIFQQLLFPDHSLLFPYLFYVVLIIFINQIFIFEIVVLLTPHFSIHLWSSPVIIFFYTRCHIFSYIFSFLIFPTYVALVTDRLRVTWKVPLHWIHTKESRCGYFCYLHVLPFQVPSYLFLLYVGIFLFSYYIISSAFVLFHFFLFRLYFKLFIILVYLLFQVHKFSYVIKLIHFY